MKKTVFRLAALIFAASLLFSSALPVSAQQNNMAEIVGIDYGRITQKAGGGLKSYPVELKLGGVTFNGELSADIGLTYEELNGIILATLAEKGLTV